LPRRARPARRLLPRAPGHRGPGELRPRRDRHLRPGRGGTGADRRRGPTPVGRRRRSAARQLPEFPGPRAAGRARSRARLPGGHRAGRRVGRRRAPAGRADVERGRTVIDDVPLSADEAAMLDVTRQVTRDVVAPRADAIAETGEFPWDVYKTFCDIGLVGLPVPKEYGGVGAGVLLQCLLAEEVAKECSVCASLIAGPSLASYPIVLAGTEDQKARLLPRLATGELQAAFALTEPEAGSDVSGLRTRAVRDGDGWVIHGQKCFITRGNIAGLLVVFAKTDPDAFGLSGISAFLVERDPAAPPPGLVVDRLERKMGQEASPTAALTFDGLRVGADCLLGEEHGGMRALRTLYKTRPLAAAVALGIATGAYDHARRHLTQRRQFGQPLAEFQGLQFMVAD